MTSRVPLAVSIPQTFPSGPIDPERIRRYLARAEALGFTGAWVVEQVVGTIPSLEPIELLTFAAAVTQRLRVGAAVLLTALRTPLHTAKSLATLDQLSGGRLDVGVGLGGQPAVYPAFGLSAERRAARFAEGVILMKRLWTEPRVTFDGEFYRLKDLPMEPKPRQRPHPPIWFGGHHPDALRRAVALGDAFMGAGSASTATFAAEVGLLRRALEAAKRDPVTFPVAKRVYIAVDDDRARAGRRLTEWFGGFYHRPQLAEEVSVWGSAEQCAEGLRAVVAAGAGMLMLNPVFDDEEQLERFAAELAPRL
ncbi:MAG TPA: LLM class flavin-dependent oxidoreductase [Verrucomicrobiae bacterium]|nr:LLM class flavin-dependent oxidoreductase [Verrucomicrobiae bacterium]